MKNKPLRHKETNTFKFQPFSDRIASIDVDVFHRVNHLNETAEESSTFFYKTIQKCNDLNLSKSYESLRNKLGYDIQTLPQLLIQKERLMSVLSQCLEEADSLCLQPCLELVVALAQDLRQEFYPFFPELLVKILNLLNTKDSDKLEWAFTCLAYLFKYLWRFLIRNLNVVFDQLLPLLSSSKPQYVTNFAAESFAFVARKVKDKRSFLKLVLKSLKEHKDGVPGCGRLLFEVIKGVQGQFHTCAEFWLRFLLESLVDHGLPRGLLLEVLTHTFISMANAVLTKHSKIFWDILQDSILKRVSLLNNEKSEENVNSTYQLLQLTSSVLEQKQCSFLVNPVGFVKTLINIITMNDWPPNIMLLFVDISGMILLSPRLCLQQELSVVLIQKVMTMGDWDLVKLFLDKMMPYSGFEMHILGRFLQICEDKELDDVLIHLTKVILKKTPPAKSFTELKNKTLYPLSSSLQWNEKFMKYLLSKLEVKSEGIYNDCKENIICALIVLPHLVMDIPAMKSDIKILISLLIKRVVDDCPSGDSLSSVLLLLHQAMSTMYLIFGKTEVEINFEKLVSMLCPLIKTHIMALQVLDISFNALQVSLKEEHLTTLKTGLVENLASPFHQVRILSAYVLKFMECDNPSSELFNILSIIINAESIEANISEYRGKVRQLQLLECSEKEERQCVFNVAINFLLGNLYINFKLLWEPVSKLVVSYAKLVPAGQFWPVFVNQLHLAVTQIETGVSTKDRHNFKCKFLCDASKNMTATEERTDVYNFRTLLWQIMTQIPEVCEEKNRDIVVLFLNFLKSEYYRISPDEATVWNIKQGKKEEIIAVNTHNQKLNEIENSDCKMEVENENMDTNELQESDNEETSEENTIPVRTASKSLLDHLVVFGCLRNPKSMFREPELIKAYYDFLSHKNPNIQKAALDCIMTYKFKYLMPYKDHLYGLIDDKTFKEEVTLFRIDTDNEIIRPEHRAELIPVVMRIVYSKMLNRSGARTGSKSARQTRRSIVFRFLAGCKQEELLFYLQMAFRVFTPKVQDDVAAMVESIQSQLDLTRTVPPKRLLSTTNLLSVVLSQCGSLLSHDALRFLLRVLLCVGATVSAALAQRDQVHSGYLNILRNIRSASIDVITKFFSAFETFSWSPEEIDSVLEVFVWPYIDKLPVEGIHSPTSLLKLFMVWSQIPRNFPLLVTYKKQSPDLTPLPFIMQLLVSVKTHGSVVNAIMDMVDRLLDWEQLPDDEDSTPVLPLVINNLLPVENYHIKGDVSFGRRILYPHLPLILERMKSKLSKPKASLGQRDLTILSHITELVHDSETSDTLLSLMLPLVGRKGGAPEHVICPLITTVTNLIRNIPKPRQYIRSLAPLFGSVVGAEPRRMLSTLVKSIDGEENGLDAKLLEDLNAWNAKWLDQPDFERRLDAFKKIQQLQSSDCISLEQGVIIIYSCFHFIRVEKDLSLRDGASQCLHTLGPYLCNKYATEQEFLVNKTILSIIATGIRDKKNNQVQQEAVTFLGYMARECYGLHVVLRDLSLLGNKTDPEVDFFENLQHLQLHRKVRALLKFCEVCKGLSKSMCTRTLTQFILPIVSHFLCSEKYVSKNTIVDAAIEVLGTVCKMLPWHHYELVLRYYLGKLRHSVEYQKQLVRVVVEILNAFHFDLSNADLTNLNKEIPVYENKTLVEPEGSGDVSVNGVVENADEVNQDQEIKDKDNENLEDVLDNDAPMEDDQNEVTEIKEVVEIPVLERIIVPGKSLATRVVFTIKTVLLPQLHRTITARTQSDALHKVNRKMAGPDRDEEDILRIPIALAAVKLLQKLPEEVLKQNISGILMKMCTFLKSRLDSVRRVTRETLQKVVVSLGPKYLLQVIQEMVSILTHGFHTHVLVYSIHSVMVAIKPFLKPGDIDPCIPFILQACRSDLFGKVSEEKEVKQIAGKLMEARANRSYDMYHILAEFTTQKCLLNLIIPLKEELGHTLSHKAVNKGRECLRHIVLGLVDNKFVSTESLLIFAYGSASEIIPALACGTKKEESNDKVKQVYLEPRADSFLIPTEPKNRVSVQSKLCARTNAHIFVEFGLMMYHFLLKREKVRGAEYRPHLDPLVKILSDCLKSEHVKITTLSLQCLCWILKSDLPSLKSTIGEITESVFKLLHKFAAAGLSKGDNFDLVMSAFKVISVVVRDVKSHQLSKQQQRTLLLYCEQDIHDYSRQALAFSLLKAILGRKLQIPELNAVMEKVAKISITADIDHVRLQARQVFHQYLMGYAMGKKFEKHLTWYLQQMEYDLQPGRESALEMIKTLINTLPANVLKEQSGFIFVTVSARLINDDVPACRKMAADIVTQLLDKVSNNIRNSLFDIVLLWMKETKILHRRLAVQLCGIFASHDKANFENRLTTVLPLIVSLVKLEIKDLKPQGQEEDVSTKEHLKDHLLYQLLHLIVKVSTLCPSLLTDSAHTTDVLFLAESAQTLLAYPHEWVRLAATQFIGRVLSVYTPEEVASICNSVESEREAYLLHNSRHVLRSLVLDLCSQLTPGKELNEKLLMQTMKNLIFLAEVLQHLRDIGSETANLSLQWLIRRVNKIIHQEIVQAPSFTILRTMCYNWIAALVVKVNLNTLQPLLPLLMAPLVRELNMPEDENSALRQVAKETANFVKKRIGTDEYNRLVNSLTTRLQVRRAERKKERAQLAVRDPEKAAKRKISKQLKKKTQKKKKIEIAKGGKLKRKNAKRDIIFEDP